jgi:hypothetical protein
MGGVEKQSSGTAREKGPGAPGARGVLIFAGKLGERRAVNGENPSKRKGHPVPPPPDRSEVLPVPPYSRCRTASKRSAVAAAETLRDSI